VLNSQKHLSHTEQKKKKKDPYKNGSSGCRIPTTFFKGHQPLATQVERKSRFAIAMRPDDMTGSNRADIINDMFGRLPNGVVKTFTFDNGPEFSRHEDIAAGLGACPT
jgi:IS30 family transposase